MSNVDTAILICSKLLEIAIIIFISKDGAREKWRWVERLCIFRICCTVIDLILRRQGMHEVYFYEFWAAEIVAIGIQLGILSAIYRVPIQAAKWLPSPAKALALILLVLSLLAIKAGYPRITFSTMPDFAIDANRVVSLLSCSILVCAALYAQALGYKLTTRSLLIDSGLCIGFLSSLLWYTLLHFNPNLHAAMGERVSNLAYLATRMIWLLAFVRSDMPEAIGQRSKEKIRAELSRLTLRKHSCEGTPEKEVETFA